MFSKNKANVATVNIERSAIGTIIGEGIFIEGGSIKGEGNVRIDGSFSGVIDLDGHIVIGETGKVDGEIDATSALFAGKFEGSLKIKETLHLAPSSFLKGNVESKKIIIDEDATFNGNCRMTEEIIEENFEENTVSFISEESAV